MRISLRQIDGAFQLKGTNATGNTIVADLSEDDGGRGDGVRPLELLLMSLGSCSGVDVISILKKGRQRIDAFEVEVTAERDGGSPINMITALHVRFRIRGAVDTDKARRAIQLSLGTYCTVTKMLEKIVPITASLELDGEDFDAGYSSVPPAALQ